MRSGELPEAVIRLLWDVNVPELDLDRDRSLVLERVMSRGTWEAMKWLRRHYSLATLAEFVRTRGRRVLAPRDLAYWSLICDVDIGPDIDAGGGRPRWAGA
jgi:hypothetical protein